MRVAGFVSLLVLAIASSSLAQVAGRGPVGGQGPPTPKRIVVTFVGSGTYLRDTWGPTTASTSKTIHTNTSEFNFTTNNSVTYTGAAAIDVYADLSCDVVTGVFLTTASRQTTVGLGDAVPTYPANEHQHATPFMDWADRAPVNPARLVTLTTGKQVKPFVKWGGTNGTPTTTWRCRLLVEQRL